MYSKYTKYLHIRSAAASTGRVGRGCQRRAQIASCYSAESDECVFQRADEAGGLAVVGRDAELHLVVYDEIFSLLYQ